MKIRRRPSRSAIAAAEQQEAAERDRVRGDHPLSRCRDVQDLAIDGIATLTIATSSIVMKNAAPTT